MPWGFEIGQVYNRRNDIHDRFGGQQQGGIITPANRALPIFLITSEVGANHGYADRLRDDGVYEYFGEGQRGDMAMRAGNASVLTHAQDGRDLLLFRRVRDGLRFIGQFVVEGFHNELSPDSDGTMRQAIVFELRAIEALEAVDEAVEPIPENADLARLRALAVAAAVVNPTAGQGNRTVYERSRQIRTYIRARAAGHCEYCGETAPFVTKDHVPFLEVHHIRRLTDGGPDDLRHMIGVCPNCHRSAHHAAEKDRINQEMQIVVNEKEGAA